MFLHLHEAAECNRLVSWCSDLVTHSGLELGLQFLDMRFMEQSVVLTAGKSED